MSTPIQHDDLDPNSLLYYAPRKSRGGVTDPLSIQPMTETSGPPVPQSSPPWRPRYDNSALVEALPDALRRLIEVEYKSRSVAFLRARTFAIAATLAAAAGLAIGIVFIDTAKFNEWLGWSQPVKEAELPLADRLQAAKAVFEQPAQKVVPPTITVQDASGDVNAPLPLGVEIANYRPGITLTVTGLLVGASMSVGAASSDGEWRIAAADVPTARVIPPLGYLGPMDVVAELRANNGQPITRGTIHYVWKQAAAVVAAAPTPAPAKPEPQLASAASAPAVVAPPPPVAAPPAEPVRQLDPKEVNALMKRAEELVSTGDLPAARLLLKRVAEGRNARAAFELAATYDPTVIKKLNVISVAPDLALARNWYQKAIEWGSTDASKQLEALASVRK